MEKEAKDNYSGFAISSGFIVFVADFDGMFDEVLFVRSHFGYLSKFTTIRER